MRWEAGERGSSRWAAPLAGAADAFKPGRVEAGRRHTACGRRRRGAGRDSPGGVPRATNAWLAGSVVVVAGYGCCGRGFAARARGAGASVIVTEVAERAPEAAAAGRGNVAPYLDAPTRITDDDPTCVREHVPEYPR